MKKMMIAAAFLSAFALTGCVTTSDQPQKRKPDADAGRDAYIQLGLGYLQEGETESAKAPLSEALKLDPRSASAHLALAMVFQQEGETASADKHYRDALSSEPGNPRILNNYGVFLLSEERYDEALGYFEKASKDTLYGERSRVFENIGLTYQRMDRLEQAKASFERALRLNSRQPLALLQMAKIEFTEQNFVPAWGYYRSFTEFSGQSAESLWLGIQLARRFEDHNRAASYALQLRRLYPASPEAKEMKASDQS
jgi:type IV pilus assembly protein PilF